MDPFENHYYSLHRKMMSVLGLWYTKTDSERSFRYYIVGTMLIYFIFVQCCQLLKVDTDLQSILFVLQYFIPTISVTSIYYIFIIQYASVKKMINFIEEDCRGLKKDVELQIMQKYTYQCKMYTLICGVAFLFFIGYFILPPVLHRIFYPSEGIDTTDRFPIFSCHDYFLDLDSYYYPILMYQIIVVAVEFTVLMSCYSGYFIAIQHICGLLCIIKTKICQSCITNNQNDIVLATPVDQSDWIIDIAQRLARSREITLLMNTIFENYYLFQTSLICVLIIVTLIYLFQIPILLEETESKKDLYMIIIFTFSCFLPVYANCYIGQRLIDYSMDVYKETCLIPIHNISLKTQKLLLTTIMLNEKPFTMSIGKVFVSSHEFFINLFRMSLSFAMVLHSTQRF